MKKIVFCLMAVAAVMMTGCTKEKDTLVAGVVRYDYSSVDSLRYISGHTNCAVQFMASMREAVGKYDGKENIELIQKENNIIFVFENISKPIDKITQEEMFEKYKSSYDRQKLSSGLGMYLSKQIIEAHQGRIYLICENEKNKFIFEMPLNNTKSSQIVW